MDRVYVIDNWLDNNLADYITNVFLKTTPFYFSQSLEDGTVIGGYHYEKKKPIDNWSSKLYGEFQIFENGLIDFLFFKAKQLFNFKIGVYRSYINIYPPSIHDSCYHTDHTVEDTDFTILYMCSKNSKDGSGCFEYIEPNTNKTKTIQYLNNRLIVFKGTTMHRGLSFNEEIRTTLTFKCFKINENCTNN